MGHSPLRRAPLILVGVLLSLIAGCAHGVSGRHPVTITVFAAASLTGSFTTLATKFEASQAGVRVGLTFGASSSLAAQIDNGAPGDVFASASPALMQKLVATRSANAPVSFASNLMEIAVPPGNPAKIGTLADLARQGVTVAECESSVPCGIAASKVFTNAGVSVTPVTRELDVKAVMAKVVLGEVDAGLVYLTDVLAAGPRVMGIGIPPAINARSTYPIAVLARSTHTALAQSFVDFVLSPAGREVLSNDGFGRP